MGKIDHAQVITKEFDKLKKEAPRSWAKILAEQTGITSDYIIKIANGTGSKKDQKKRAEILSLLRKLVEDEHNEIEKILTA